MFDINLVKQKELIHNCPQSLRPQKQALRYLRVKDKLFQGKESSVFQQPPIAHTQFLGREILSYAITMEPDA